MLILCLILLAFESVYVIKYVTRFTEEIFAFLIASVFLTDAAKKIIKVSIFCRGRITPQTLSLFDLIFI